MQVLITGCAGFIGFHLSKYLIKNEIEVVGFDNINDYYDPKLKEERLKNLKNYSQNKNINFYFEKGDLEDNKKVESIFQKYNPEIVINLAAQAGVRYSLINPKAYINANVVGFTNIIESCKTHKIKHLIFASSSSVYGGNQNLPFLENHNVDHPVSLYAATKKMNELIGHTYSHLYGLPVTGLRFFTVYGPWGRPDMALFKFTKSIIKNEYIEVYNNGDMIRDFTYIDDIVHSIFKLLKKPPKENINFDKSNPDPSKSWAPYSIFNIGNSDPKPLMEYINCLEKSLGKKAKIKFMPMQPGDVKSTYADTKKLEKWINFKPSTNIEIGIDKFVNWYKKFYKTMDLN